MNERYCHNCRHYDGPYDSGETLYGPWCYLHDDGVDWMVDAAKCAEFEVEPLPLHRSAADEKPRASHGLRG